MVNKMRLINIFLILTVIFSSIAFAEVTDYLKLNEVQNITLNCIDCGSTINCNITLLNPDKTKIVNNKQMTQGIPYTYQLDTNNVTKYGDYRVMATCYNSTQTASTDYIMRANWNGGEFISQNNTGIYIVMVIIIAGCLYSAFTLNKRYSFSKGVLFATGFVNLLGALLIVFSDVTNANLTTPLWSLVIINCTLFLIIVYDVTMNIMKDHFTEKETKEENI
jgi:hypothetical protein